MDNIKTGLEGTIQKSHKPKKCVQRKTSAGGACYRVILLCLLENIVLKLVSSLPYLIGAIGKQRVQFLYTLGGKAGLSSLIFR